MNDPELRLLIAESLPHDNKEFLRQIREGEQDDGPYMVAARIVRDHITQKYALLRPSGEVSDE